MKRNSIGGVPHVETRIECEVILYIKKNDDKWIVYKLVREPNHELFSPKSSIFLRVHRKKTKVQKQTYWCAWWLGLHPCKITSILYTESGGIDDVGFRKQDVVNYLRANRQKQLEKGDAQLMLSYFKDCQLKNPWFFYAFQIDVEGQLVKKNWADWRSRMTYKYFGDVTFDSTYLTNRYKMPFVLFTGFNHHQQLILLGCALLWDETKDIFFFLNT